MKHNISIISFFVLLAISATGCLKREAITPAGLPMYVHEFLVSPPDPDFGYKGGTNSYRCFICMRGYTLDPQDVAHTQGYLNNRNVNVPYKDVDLGYYAWSSSGTYLVSLASQDADYYFSYNYQTAQNQDITSWPVRNEATFYNTTLQLSDFDSLKHIEAAPPLFITPVNDKIQITAGIVIGYKGTNGYGLIYVKSADAYGAALEAKSYIKSR